MENGNKKKNTVNFKTKYLHFKATCFPNALQIKPYTKKAALPDRDIINSVLLVMVSIFYSSFLTYLYSILIIHFSISIVNLFE